MGIFKKEVEEIIAVFDIGNGSIGGSLIKLDLNKQPIVLYSYREPLTFTPLPSSKYLIANMIKMLGSVSKHLVSDGLSHIRTTVFGSHSLRDAYCIFSSPWYISQTKIIQEQREKPFNITHASVDALIAKEQEQFNVALKEGKYAQVFDADTRLFEKRLINIKLNGYEVIDPFNKQAKELELTLFSSYISQGILDAVEKTLHSAFSVRKIHHFSYGLVLWNSSQVLFPDIHDYFFFDISGETTDMSIVIKDVLLESVSFPMGRNTLLRRVVKELGLTSDVALSSLTMRFSDKLEKKFANRIDEALKPVEQDWRDMLSSALSRFEKNYTLPKAGIVTADLDTSRFFVKALEKNCPQDIVLSKDCLSVLFIGADTVQPYLTLASGVKQDTFIAVEAIFLNKMFAYNQ